MFPILTQILCTGYDLHLMGGFQSYQVPITGSMLQNITQDLSILQGSCEHTN